MPRLSVIVITYQEAGNIAACLDSVAFADEIVVVDSGSTDGTREIAAARGARVIEHGWIGYGPQKAVALGHATGDWVLSLDADERVSPELKAEIEAAIARESGLLAYDMPRASTFLNRTMRHSGWYPDRVLRLFKRKAGRFSDDLVHERVIVTGPVGHLRADLIHHPVRRIEDALRRMDRYSTLGAEKLVAAGRRPSFAMAILRGLGAFLRTYILRLGFLDGREGFILAIANSEGTYYRYLKAWLATRDAP